MMIGGIAQQRLRAVQLFQKNDTRQLVGQSLRAERYQMPSSGAHGFRQAERSPENKAGATVGVTRQFFKEAGEFARRHATSLFIKTYNNITSGKDLKNAFSLFLFSALSGQRRIGIFDDVFCNGSPAADPFHIMVRGIAPEYGSGSSHRNNMQRLEAHAGRLRQSFCHGKHKETGP